MKTYETKTQTREFSVLKSIACDRCEKEIEITHKDIWGGCPAGVDLVIGAGYGSRFDFTASENDWRFDICDDCCEEFLKSFKKDYLTVHWDEDK